MDRELFVSDLGSVLDRHGVEAAVVMFRDGDGLVTTVLANNPVWAAMFEVIGTACNEAAKVIKPQVASAMVSALDAMDGAANN